MTTPEPPSDWQRPTDEQLPYQQQGYAEPGYQPPVYQQQGYAEPGYQQYPPPVHGQQPPYPYPYPYPPARQTNGMAIASMVLGIVWVYWIGSILALIFGYLALAEIRRSRQGGEGMAIAGIVLGWIGVGVLAIVLLAVVTGGFR
jgi:uncharacterized protein DUF4190